jgi:hypothetical protein
MLRERPGKVKDVDSRMTQLPFCAMLPLSLLNPRNPEPRMVAWIVMIGL